MANHGQELDSLIPALELNQSPEKNEHISPARLSLNLLHIYENAKPSVVGIVSTTPTSRLYGSGTMVTKDGDLETDYHCIADATSIDVYTDSGKHYTASLLKADPKNDLALLSLVHGKNETFKPVSLAADSTHLLTGASVMAVGFPDVWHKQFLSLGQFTTTNLLVDYVPRMKTPLADWENKVRIMDEFAMNTQEGESGAPILDMNGKVVGLVKMSAQNNLTITNRVEAMRALLQSALTPT